MGKFIILAVIVSMAVLVHAFPQAHDLFRCDDDEEMVTCLPPCPRSCSNLFNPRPCTVLLPTCRTGCSCKGGKIRGNDGRCVFPADCPRRN
uniref:Putative protease inhibitor n=1 Tax=Superstitionia donensis TaxID=311983 RepID=A0A1V1WBJ7_9SCOR